MLPAVPAAPCCGVARPRCRSANACVAHAAHRAGSACPAPSAAQRSTSHHATSPAARPAPSRATWPECAPPAARRAGSLLFVGGHARCARPSIARRTRASEPAAGPAAWRSVDPNSPSGLASDAARSSPGPAPVGRRTCAVSAATHARLPPRHYRALGAALSAPQPSSLTRVVSTAAPPAPARRRGAETSFATGRPQSRSTDVETVKPTFRYDASSAIRVATRPSLSRCVECDGGGSEGTRPGDVGLHTSHIRWPR